MRILLIHQAFCGPGDPGGTRHYEIARELVENGHEVTIVTSRYNYLSGCAKTDHVYPVGLKVLFAPTLSGLHRSYFSRMLSFLSFAFTSLFLALRSGSQDVIFGTSPPIFQSVTALIVAVIRGRPFVMEVRDLWPEFAIALGVVRNSALIGIARMMEKMLYRFADHMIVNSPAYAAYLKKQGVATSKIAIVPNGVDVSMFYPDECGENFRAKHSLTDSFVVMYAGALGLANGVEYLLQAADLLRAQSEIKFLIVGSGKHEKQLRDHANALRLANVVFVPVQPKGQMPEILAAADVFVATLAASSALQVTLPNKVFDYMAAGRPTILAMAGPIREVIENSGGGMCAPPGDSHALAQAILRLRSSPSVRAEMAKRARRYVEQYFDRKEHAQRLVGILHNVVEGFSSVNRAAAARAVEEDGL